MLYKLFQIHFSGAGPAADAEVILVLQRVPRQVVLFDVVVNVSGGPIQQGMVAEYAVAPLCLVAHLCPLLALCRTYTAYPHIIGQENRVQRQYLVQMTTMIGIWGKQEPTQAVALLDAIDRRTQDVHFQVEAFGQTITE